MNAPDCAAILADLLLAQGPSGWACPEAVGPLAFEFTGMVPSFGTVFRHRLSAPYAPQKSPFNNHRGASRKLEEAEGASKVTLLTKALSRTLR